MAITNRAPGRWFPPSHEPRLLESLLYSRRPPRRVHCPICGSVTDVEFTDNVRESGHCGACGGWNRLRQLAVVILEVAAAHTGRRCDDLRELGRRPELRRGAGWPVYNTEAHGPVHDALSGTPGYVCSEYFGPELESGTQHPSGVRHEDLQALSLPSSSMELVVSTDVFEHVPDPYRAHREVARVLRPGGHHVFTVPFDDGCALDQVRARLDGDGRIVHLRDPIYHDDPVRPDEGALVYTVFGLEMVVELTRLGFRTAVYRLHDRRRGIVGDDAIVFDAVRQPPAVARQRVEPPGTEPPETELPGISTAESPPDPDTP